MRNFILLVLLFQFMASLISACWSAGLLLGKAWIDLLILVWRGLKALLGWIRGRKSRRQPPSRVPSADDVHPLKDDRPE